MAFINIHEFRKHNQFMRPKHEVNRLKTLEACFGYEINESINQRAHVHNAVAAKAINGVVYLVVDSIDCDRTRGHYEYLVDADPREIIKTMCEILRDAEGPTTFGIRSVKEV